MKANTKTRVIICPKNPFCLRSITLMKLFFQAGEAEIGVTRERVSVARDDNARIVWNLVSQRRVFDVFVD